VNQAEKWENNMMLSVLSRRGAIGIVAAGLSFLSFSVAQAASTVTVWCWDKNFNGATMKEAGDRYTKMHPEVTINIVDFAKADLEQKLQAQLASGTTDGLPDIVLIEDYGAQKYLQSFTSAFEPLSDTGAIDYKTFANYKVALATVGDKTYSLPFDSGVSGMFYRSDYLAEAGYKNEDLQDITWDKLIEIGKAVEAKTGHKMLDLDLSDVGLLRIMMQSAGSWYFTPDGKAAIKDSATFKAVLSAYAKIVQSNIYKPVSGWAEYTGGFTSGEVAAAITGVWMTGTIKANPDQAGKWAIAPIPKLDGVEGATHASNLGGSSWYVLASAPNKAPAVDFLAQVWGKDADFYQKILVNQGALGSFMAAREGAAYKASDPFFGGAAVWQNFSTWLGQIPGVNFGVFTNEADAAVAAQLPGLAKGGSVDEAIAAIDAQLTQQMQ
jgi:lactose/L-arabinose transport system substrate-binding protein